MIEPERIALCVVNAEGSPRLIVRRIGSRVAIDAQIGGVRLSASEARHVRRALSRAIREVEELNETEQPVSLPMKETA